MDGNLELDQRFFFLVLVARRVHTYGVPAFQTYGSYTDFLMWIIARRCRYDLF